MTKGRGFTLIEMLAVVAIVSLLASLLYPVYAEARQGARRTYCLGNLRQIGQAYSLYRSDSGGDGVYGTMEEMGIPPDPVVLIKGGLAPREIFFCTEHNEKGSSRLYTAFFAPENTVGVPSWQEYVLDHREQSFLFADRNHDFADASSSPFLSHRAFGVHLDGHVSTIVRRGDPSQRPWWHPEAASKKP